MLGIESLVVGPNITTTEDGNISGPSAQEVMQSIKLRKA
jgi:hypothetical protein